MSSGLLISSLICSVFVLNAHWPQANPVLLVPSFFASWFTIELAPWLLFWEAVIVTVLVANGALDETAGWVGLAVAMANAAGLGFIIGAARTTVVTIRGVIEELDPGPDAPRFPRSHVVFPILMQRRKGVVRDRHITFAEYGKKKVRLDVHKPADAKPGDRRPGILQIHGGGWVVGDKREQGQPLLNHLAANGWVGVNANYRLSPRATFPDHLIDLKKAIAWYREHAEEHGADPDFLCVTGGSAGGHLCALVALTANDPDYQPGFEDVDTSVRAAVPFYGAYDFTNRHATWPKLTVERFFGPVILKKKLSEDPEAFAKASPLDQVHADAPPFFVIHGSNDTLCPVHDARDFVARLREASSAPVLYAEMQGAQHAFEIFPSYRTMHVIEGVERFLHVIHTEYLRGVEGDDVSDAEVAEAVSTGGTPSRRASRD